MSITPSPPLTTAGARPGRRLLLRVVAPLLPIVAVAGAGGLGWLLVAGWHVPPAAAAAFAAAIGVLVAALPLALFVRRSLGALATAPAAAELGALRTEPTASFLDRATREIARARRYGSGAALLLVDVDRAARADDAQGRAGIDRAVQMLLQQTAHTLRGADLLARFSATQLAVLLSPADLTGAFDVAERIRERAEQLPMAAAAGAAPLQLTVSVGVAILRPAPADLRTLIEDVGAALALAWQAGGNCVRAAPDDLGRLAAPGPRDGRRKQPK